MNSKLTALQHRLAEEFFTREGRFVLTGGGALCGYLLGHRGTKDLDLFATEALLEDGEKALQSAAEALGGTVQSIVHAQDFRRLIVRAAGSSVVVDLVHDRAAKGTVPRPRFGSVVVDPPEEILSNKLCTLLSRSEMSSAGWRGPCRARGRGSTRGPPVGRLDTIDTLSIPPCQITEGGGVNNLHANQANPALRPAAPRCRIRGPRRRAAWAKACAAGGDGRSVRASPHARRCRIR